MGDITMCRCDDEILRDDRSAADMSVATEHFNLSIINIKLQFFIIRIPAKIPQWCLVGGFLNPYVYSTNNLTYVEGSSSGWAETWGNYCQQNSKKNEALHLSLSKTAEIYTKFAISLLF